MIERPKLLPYPDDGHDHPDDFNDLGLAADLNMLSRAVVDRRRVLSLGVAGIAALVAGGAGFSRAAVRARSAACVPALPGETAGPFPADGSNASRQSLNVLNRSGIVRRDLRTSLGTKNRASGVPLTLKMTLVDVNAGCAPLAGYAVYAWHCTADGNYSLYSDAVVEEDFLRGVQATGRDGTLTFTTVFPGCYPGRWPHVHFEVFPSLGAATSARGRVLTSQLALPEGASRAVYATPGHGDSLRHLGGMSLAGDLVFRDGYASQLAQVTGDPARGYTATLTVGLAR